MRRTSRDNGDTPAEPASPLVVSIPSVGKDNQEKHRVRQMSRDNGDTPAEPASPLVVSILTGGGTRKITTRVATNRHCAANKMLQKFSPWLPGRTRRRCQETKQKHRRIGQKMPARAATTPRVATYRRCMAEEMLLSFQVGALPRPQHVRERVQEQGATRRKLEIAHAAQPIFSTRT